MRTDISFTSLPCRRRCSVLTPEMVFYLIVRATGPEVHEMDTGLLFAPGATEHPEFESRLEQSRLTGSEIMAQDQHVDKLVQIGLRSRHAAEADTLQEVPNNS